jgi:hypothetical protein
MIRNIHKINYTTGLFLSGVVLGIVVFYLSISLVKSRQHALQDGYLISDLEQRCYSYNQKISELDKRILSMVSRSKITGTSKRETWKAGAKVVCVSKFDVQSYVLAKNGRANATVAKNFSRTN